ncbi:MAG: protein-glutamate O-methyltransferase CheR [Rhodomicrobium sp.]|nr:protein-glutamate O-methyltransferase CheR [Rhodomicrobium sp.]
MTAKLGESEAQKTRSFDSLCAYLRKASGLVLDPEKRYLVESRVTPVMKRAGLSELGQLVQLLEQGRMPSLAEEVVQAMTINETYFFRDRYPFDALRQILPKLMIARAAQKSIRVWSAAASTGQEPYSIAMIMHDFAPVMANWRSEIFATDLSQAALARADAARYSQFEVQRGLAPEQVKRYFRAAGDMFQLRDEIKARVKFKPFNLLSPYDGFGQFDLIFCRNVLIYFEAERKADILRRMTRILAKDGILVLGASESIIGLNVNLKPHPDYRGFFINAV